MPKRTLKGRIGDILVKTTPFNRRTLSMLRWEYRMFILRTVNTLSLRHRNTVRLLADRRDLSVNIASGGKGLPGWINIEGFPAEDNILKLDVRRRLPLADGSAKRVLAEHVLEHLEFRTDAPNLIHEAHRILTPGGVFRVIVPDAERFVRAYAADDRDAFRSIGWDLDCMPHDIYSKMHILNHIFHQEGEHFFAYDFETLDWLLRRCGFSDVRQMSYKNSLDPELAIDQPNHAPYSLYVDAVR